jgi:hypothetical protein
MFLVRSQLCDKLFGSDGIPPDDLRRRTMDIHLHLPGAFALQLVALIFAGLATRRTRK